MSVYIVLDGSYVGAYENLGDAMEDASFGARIIKCELNDHAVHPGVVSAKPQKQRV